MNDHPSAKRPTILGAQVLEAPGYDKLAAVLGRAFDQATTGKGKERHARGRDFDGQPIMAISQLLQTDGGLAFQAIKKIEEARGLETRDARVRELLGAIVYVAAMIIREESQPNDTLDKLVAKARGKHHLDELEKIRPDYPAVNPDWPEIKAGGPSA